MNQQTDMEHKTLQHLSMALKSLPNRRTSGQFQKQVLHAIEQRRLASWWQQGFHCWPLSARVAVISASVAALYILTSLSRWQPLFWPIPFTSNHVISLINLWPTPLPTVIHLQQAMLQVLHRVPLHWLISIASLLAVIYLSLILSVTLTARRFSHPDIVGHSI